jgi:hypothetical protein
MKTCVESVCMKPLSTISRRLFLLAGLGVTAVLPRALLRRLLPRMLTLARSTTLPAVRRRDPARHWRRVYRVDAVAASE